mmetsp:Transcript_14636/g.35350  ORF Transcript_14636/g.35350 Transcript_14636/m.35350 type:complete len:268 (+) Transcript_14636:381-1184(+)
MYNNPPPRPKHPHTLDIILQIFAHHAAHALEQAPGDARNSLQATSDTAEAGLERRQHGAAHVCAAASHVAAAVAEDTPDAVPAPGGVAAAVAAADVGDVEVQAAQHAAHRRAHAADVARQVAQARADVAEPNTRQRPDDQHAGGAPHGVLGQADLLACALRLVQAVGPPPRRLERAHLRVRARHPVLHGNGHHLRLQRLLLLQPRLAREQVYPLLDEHLVQRDIERVVAQVLHHLHLLAPLHAAGQPPLQLHHGRQPALDLARDHHR